MISRAGAIIGAAVIAVTAMMHVAIAPAASAESAYRYWTYWTVTDSAWAFSHQGAGTSIPADGSVEGWHFAVSGSAADAKARPGVDASTAFADICGGQVEQPGRKRVALVIDPGPAGIAPDGEAPGAPVRTCVVADTDATGYEILRSQVPVRVEGGLVCGVDGYPAHECAPVVDASLASAMPDPATANAASNPLNSMVSVGSGNGGSLATILVVLFIAALGYFLLRKRKS